VDAHDCVIDWDIDLTCQPQVRIVCICFLLICCYDATECVAGILPSIATSAEFLESTAAPVQSSRSSSRKLLHPGAIGVDIHSNAIASTRDYIIRAASASDPVGLAKTTAGAVVWGTQAVQTVLGSTAKPSSFDDRPSRKEVFKRARTAG